MFVYYNAHPKGLHVGDCVKRAISRAAEMDYMEVQRELNRHKKVTGCKQFNDRGNPEHFVEHVLGGVRQSFPAEKGKPRMNGERFCKSFPKGNYILNMAGHWSCCIDGVIYDTWDPSEKCVYSCYKITPKTDYYKLTHTTDSRWSITVVTRDRTWNSTFLTKDEINGYVKCLKDIGIKEYKI